MTMESKKTLIFWVKFALFTIFGLIIPLAFIIWRYDLFTKVSATTFGVWGIICLIIAFAIIVIVTRYLTKGAPYSYATQIINGVLKVILPCLLVWVIAYKLKDTIDLFLQVMGVVTISEFVAIIINPFPKWMKEKGIEQNESLIDLFLEKRNGTISQGKRK